MMKLSVLECQAGHLQACPQSVVYGGSGLPALQLLLEFYNLYFKRTVTRLQGFNFKLISNMGRRILSAVYST